MAPNEPAELLLGAGQAGLETFDRAEPAFRLGFGDSGDQVVADLGKSRPLGRVRSRERASDASVFMNARGPKARAQVPMDTFRGGTDRFVSDRGVDALVPADHLGDVQGAGRS
ncbi:hypothetical protein AB0B95_16710 [Streptomyces hygroscopicus]|uniref:hypothetical protein n=1 Tax=Streptomyces hygroscopicus TaxID=1912 RepID=UPI000AE97AED|nr:hypothetical protein [Streptomyces hygroscopicus]